jgi:hypothetical protein
MTLKESPLSRLMNFAAPLVPDQWWQTRKTLKIMGHAARIMLGTGKMNLAGKTPNGHEFIANPQRVWLIDSSRAVVNETDLGPAGALNQQASLNEFLIPQRGVFAIARAFMEAPKGTSDQRFRGRIGGRDGVSQQRARRQLLREGRRLAGGATTGGRRYQLM